VDVSLLQSGILPVDSSSASSNSPLDFHYKIPFPQATSLLEARRQRVLAPPNSLLDALDDPESVFFLVDPGKGKWAGVVLTSAELRDLTTEKTADFIKNKKDFNTRSFVWSHKNLSKLNVTEFQGRLTSIPEYNELIELCDRRGLNVDLDLKALASDIADGGPDEDDDEFVDEVVEPDSSPAEDDEEPRTRNTLDILADPDFRRLRHSLLMNPRTSAAFLRLKGEQEKLLRGENESGKNPNGVGLRARVMTIAKALHDDAAAAAPPGAPVPPTPTKVTFVIGDGRGFGEGVGISQRLARMSDTAVLYVCETNTSKKCPSCREVFATSYEDVTVSMRLTPIKGTTKFYVSHVEDRKVYLEVEGDLASSTSARLYRPRYTSEVDIEEVFDVRLELVPPPKDDDPVPPKGDDSATVKERRADRVKKGKLALVKVTIHGSFPLWNSRKCDNPGCALVGKWLHRDLAVGAMNIAVAAKHMITESAAPFGVYLNSGRKGLIKVLFAGSSELQPDFEASQAQLSLIWSAHLLRKIEKNLPVPSS
jgi:hypothetical protein